METVANNVVHQDGITKKAAGKFGTLGLDVGVFGRWSRLLWGVAFLVPLAVGAVYDFKDSGSSLSFYGWAGIYVLGIGAGYVLVYWSLGDRIFARANPWLNTVVFVAPAFVAAWWELLFHPLTGLDLPSSFPAAMWLYIGISFVLQWKIRYGGCEVVALPIILLKRRYATYCIPLVAFDAVEKVVVERVNRHP